MPIEIKNLSGMEFVTLANNKNLKIVFNNFGASIYCIYFHGEIMTPQVVNEKDFLDEAVHFGKTVGRVAGRIANHTLVIDGVSYDLSCNDGTNTLHGGHYGVGTQFFKSKVYENSLGLVVEYSHLSKDGESGFPGEADIRVTYTLLKEEDKLDIRYHVTTSKTCPISLSPHTLFNLGETNIDNLSLYIDSSKYISTSSKTLVCEEIRDVPLCLDFRKMHKIIDYIDDPILNVDTLSGYDHNFLIDSSSKMPQVVLASKKYSLDIHTDYNCVVMYSDNFVDEYKFNSSNQTNRRAIAIEPECSLMDNILLKPEEVFAHYITYNFRKLS